ncbi:Asp-tRNA(Asn)/Glu-tRNA(Gln) amidotransferase subunit GatA [bacterium]|nr:Asp-tRNA(Asn)/Glu-tRNA(Gln) amidotransferase subunit GatA [bacterium]
MEIFGLTAREISEKVRKKEISPKEVVSAFLERVEEIEPKVRAFISITPELAMETAKQIEEHLMKGEDIGLLAGVPIAIKDNICTKGIRTTCASRILENFVPPYDATVVKLLKEAGAIIVGKTNMDEFAMGSSTENSAFFPTHNPYDLDRVPGGSSGGSAAAVSAREAPLALGSDTGGSIRQPASFCGIVGFKPTYGRVSRYGLVAFASSLDQIGPLTANVGDCILLFSIIAQYDPLDSTSAPLPTPPLEEMLVPEAKGLKIGLVQELFGEGIEEEVKEKVLEAVKYLEEKGAIVEWVSLPHLSYALPCYYIIAPSEASSNLARYDGVKYGLRVEADGIIPMYMETRDKGFGPEVKRRIMLGTYALSAGYYDAYYLKALKVRTLIKRDFDKAFEKFDILISPTSPIPPFKIGEKIDDPLKMYMADICTIPINLAALPAISLPAGLDSQGLPVGLQMIGKPFEEVVLLKTAFAYEEANPLLPLKPPI